MNEEYIKTETENIKRDPYNYIMGFYEEMYPMMGKRVMEILSLVPTSLILPDFTDTSGKSTATRINYLLLASPGMAKTSLSEHFKKIALNPFPFESITDSSLSSELDKLEQVTIIVSDVARIFRVLPLVKQLENVIGDEGKLSRITQRTKIKKEKMIDAVGYFAGTPANLSQTISDGIIFRVCPDVVLLTNDQHNKILLKINSRIGKPTGQHIHKEQIIIDYYSSLYQSILEYPIKGYGIPEYFRDEVKDKLMPMFENVFNETEFAFIRELNQCYKFMVSHAYLNINNRKVKDGILQLEDQDLRVALNLTTKELKIKSAVLKAINIVSENKMKTLQDLKYWMAYQLKEKPDSVSILEYKILKIIVRGR